MSVIWSGITEAGAVVPVQVTDEGKVVAVGDGPQGDYLPITGGNLTGDLEVDGSITAAGGFIELRSAGTIRSKAALSGDTHFIDVGTQSDAVYINSTSTGSATSKPLNFYVKESGTTTTHTFATDGSVEFGGSITADGNVISGSLNAGGGGGNYFSKGEVASYSGFSSSYLWRGWDASGSSNVLTSSISADGSAEFAGGKCGFTSEGELFFTSRGTRYKLFVSQGICQVEEYTRQMELKEKAEQFIADKRETKPSEPQPQPPQPEVTPDNDNA